MALDKNKIKQNVTKFVSQKKYAEAIREQQKLVDDSPKDIPTLQYLGNIYLMAGQKEQAVPVFIRVAELYHKSGFTPKALASIKIALREAPDNTQALELYATFAEQTGLQRDAIDAYEKLVSSYTTLGQLDKAESILAKLLDLNHENIKYQLQHGDLLTRLNRKEEAIPSYLKAAENLVAQGKIKESAKIYERILQIDAKKITALENSVKNLLNQKEPQKALELLDTVVAGREVPSIINELKADILISLRDFDKAEAILRKTSEKSPIRGSLLQRFMRLYLSQNKFEILIRLIGSQIPSADAVHLKELEGAFEEIISQSPSTLEAFSGLIVVQRKIGDKGRLLSTLSKYSDILLEKNDYKGAEAVVKEMLEIAPNEMQLMAKIDDIREKLGYGKVEPPRQKEPEVIVIEKEKEFQQEKGEKEILQETEPDVEIEVEIEDISSEMPIATVEKEKEKEKVEQKIESLSPEQIEVTSTFTSPPVIEESESDSISIDIEGEEEIKEAGVTAIEEETEVKEKEEIEESEVEPKELPSKEFDERTAAAIQEKFSEAQIFLKYGLVEKAIGELQSVLKIVPDHIQAHQKLIGIYRQLDKKDKLVRQIIKLANVFRQQGDLDTAENLVEEAMQIDPNHKAILEFAEKRKAAETEPEKISGIKELDALAEIVKGKKVEAPKAAEKIEEIEKKVDVEEEIKEIKEEIKEEEKEIEIDINQEETVSQPENLIEVEEQSFEEVPEKDNLEKKEEPPKEVEEESFSVEISPEEIERSSELNEKLEEAEFYFAQELYEDAKRICEELNGKFPEDVRVIDLLGRINVAIEKTKEELEVQEIKSEEKKEEEQPAAETKGENYDDLSLLDQDLVKDLGGVVPAERKRTRVKVTLRDVLPEEEKPKEEEKPALESGEEFYDLAKELGAALEGLEDTASGLFDEEGEEKTSEEMSFEEVFKEFKKGVEKKVAEEDYDTHYNLGIAYKEMELIDEAIGEFQIAARSPMFFADSCAMLGKCFQVKGLYDLAEKWYRKGLDSRGFPEDVYNGLKYDLAQLLEETDRKKEALELYKEVYASNANYREVKDKISSLK